MDESCSLQFPAILCVHLCSVHCPLLRIILYISNGIWTFAIQDVNFDQEAVEQTEKMQFRKLCGMKTKRVNDSESFDTSSTTNNLQAVQETEPPEKMIRDNNA